MPTPKIAAIGFEIFSPDGSVAALEPQLRAHAEIGTEAIELGVSSLDIVAGGRLIENRVAALESLVRRFSFTYTVHGLVSSNFMDPGTCARQLAAAEAMVEICARVGSTILVQHSGSLRADQPADRAGAEARETEALMALAASAKRKGVRIALENIFTTAPGEYRPTPSEVAMRVAALDHPNLVATIDVSHAAIESTHRGLDFRAELRAMAPVAGHLHIHDSFAQMAGRTPFYYPAEATALGLGDLHLPLGWGDIAWDDVAEDLQAVRPDTVMILEIGARYREEHAASLEKARRIAKSIERRADPA